MSYHTSEFFLVSSQNWNCCDPSSMPFWEHLSLSSETTANITYVPFWTETQLLRVQDPLTIGDGAFLWFLIYKNQNAYFLSGNSDGIFMANAKELPKWNAESLMSYLKFFCYFMRGLDGSSFLIIDSIDNDALSELLGSKLSELTQYIHLPDINLDDECCSIETCVWYTGKLYKGKYLIKRTGEVIMESDELLCDLDIKPLAPMFTNIEQLIKPTESPEIQTIAQPIISANPRRSANNNINGQHSTQNAHAMLHVLDHIESAENPEISSVLQRYAWLEDSNCNLALVPDLAPIVHILEGEFPWFDEVTKWIMLNLSVKALTKMPFYLPPFLLAGPPGIGKTAYCSRLARLIQIAYRQIPLAGKSDSRDLVGTSRGWAGCNPSMPIRLIHESRIANPMIVLDEIDKVGESTSNGHIWSALHEFLEPECSRRLYDEFLGGHANLSHISWVATANQLSKFPSSLRQRFKVFHVKGPRQEDYLGIVMRTIQQFAKQHQLDPNMIPRINTYDWELLQPNLTNPRIARRATETWLAHRLVHPGPNEHYH